MSTIRRKGVQFVPKTWIVVKPAQVIAFQQQRAIINWCHQNAGVYKADWDFYGYGQYRFRDQDTATLFTLTWG